jgi:hypothetical protein
VKGYEPMFQHTAILALKFNLIHCINFRIYLSAIVFLLTGLEVILESSRNTSFIYYFPKAIHVHSLKVVWKDSSLEDESSRAMRSTLSIVHLLSFWRSIDYT